MSRRAIGCVLAALAASLLAHAQVERTSKSDFAGRWEIRVEPPAGGAPGAVLILEVSAGAEPTGKVVDSRVQVTRLKELSVKGGELVFVVEMGPTVTFRGKRSGERLEGTNDLMNAKWVGVQTTRDKLEAPVETEDQKAFNAAVRSDPRERIAALEKFAADFPNSPLREQARFQAAAQPGPPTQRKAALEKFLADFPDGRLKDQATFQLAVMNPNAEERLAALEKFVADFPKSSSRVAAYNQMLAPLLARKPLDEERLRRVIDDYIGSTAEAPISLGNRIVDTRADASNNVADRLMVAEVMLDKALELIQKALARVTDKTSPSAKAMYLTTLGQVQFKRKDYEAAESALKSAIDAGRGDESAEAQLYLAKVYEARGNNEAALDLYLQAAAKTGGAEVKGALEKAYRAKYGSLAGLHERIDTTLLSRPKPFEPGRYDGAPRKVVLAELFTGSECRPCIAADLAFDGLIERYGRKDVAILEYHLHIPGPDPMTQSDSLERAKYYGVGGTPTVIVDGSDKHMGGGLADGASRNFELYKGKIEKRLDAAAPAQLTALKLERKGDDIAISGRVALDQGIDAAKTRLRLALAEDVVHYTGGNGIHFHHFVVRKMLGSAEGIRIDDQRDFSLRANLAELKGQLGSYLDTYEKSRTNFRWSEKPIDVRSQDLVVVALVQNDDTREVLQAAFVK
jgi:tetratricopeptide (TPR) repeat protein